MKISIITATLNRVDFIDKCLASVENQTFRDIEHIFIDGFSTDGTVEKIQEYIKRNKDIKCKFIQTTPKGISNAMNVGIKNATGDIIHFLHSDDYYLEDNSLKKVEKEFRKNTKVNWLIGSVGLEFKHKKLIIGYKILLDVGLKNLVGISLIPHENTFMKKSLFDKYGLFKEDIKITMDYDYWMNLLKTEIPLITRDCYTIFIIHNKSMSSNPNNWIRVLKERITIWKDHRAMPIIGYVEDNDIYKTYKEIQSFIEELTNNN